MSGAPADRVALVTGAGAGIGREASLALARAGYSVVCADLDGESACAVRDTISASGLRAAAIACNVAREESWPAMLGEAAKLGRLATLIGNAAIFPRIAFEAMRIADFDRVMAVNLRAAFLGAKACVPVLEANGGGSVVFMTSGSGLPAAAAKPMQRGFSLYGASKAALDRWALGIAPEVSPMAIAVNLLCPGAPVETDGFNRLGLAGEAPAQRIPARRVAEAIACLADRRPPQTGERLLATEFGAKWGGTAW